MQKAQLAEQRKIRQKQEKSPEKEQKPVRTGGQMGKGLWYRLDLLKFGGSQSHHMKSFAKSCLNTDDYRQIMFYSTDRGFLFSLPNLGFSVDASKEESGGGPAAKEA